MHALTVGPNSGRDAHNFSVVLLVVDDSPCRERHDSEGRDLLDLVEDADVFGIVDHDFELAP